MGSLSNLYISQSYISLLHLGSDTTASSTLTAIEDGLGNSIGVSVNTEGDVALAGTLSIKRGLDITGSVKINTAVTASTQQYVNSGNQFTDNIIRITGSYDSGSAASPGVYQIQNGWKCFGPGLGDDGATVIANTYVPGTGWTFTIDENTAVWFGLYNFTDPAIQYYNFAVSGSEDITGSLWVRDNFSVTNISASGNISASNLWVKDTIHAYKLDVTIESSSIIFTSGSNILGDEANVDTQTLIGRVIVSGSLEVTGSTRINGNTTITGSTILSGSTTNIISNTTITGSTIISGSTTITGSITASGNISSSTLSGIGNVTLYSASVSQRIETNSSSFYNFSSSQYKTDSASFESQILTNSASFAAYSSSLVATFATNAFVLAQTASLSASIYLTDATQSFNISTKLDTASFNSYSASVFLTDATQSNNITSLTAKTGSYATTGSNSFIGNQIITGSLIISSSIDTELSVIGNSTFSGSVKGNTIPITITSLTASIDCSLGNFFTLQLPNGGSTSLNFSNANPGQTISLKITQGNPVSTVTYTSNIKFPTNFAYVASTTANAVDILTFISYDTTTLYGVAVNKLQ